MIKDLMIVLQKEGAQGEVEMVHFDKSGSRDETKRGGFFKD